MWTAVSRAVPLSHPTLCHRELSIRFPLWLMFLNERPLRAEASTLWGVGFSQAWHRQPALAAGPALKQEERKSPVNGERPGGKALPPSTLWGWLWGLTCLAGAHPHLGRDLGYQQRQGRWQEGGEHKEGQPQPGPRVSERIRRSGQCPLSAQKARLKLTLK